MKTLGITHSVCETCLALVPAKTPCVLAINKVDRVRPRSALLPALEAWGKERDFAAVVPIAASILPLSPMRIPLCDSFATWSVTAMRACFAPSSNRSTVTATPCGTSWRVRLRICSRTSSETRKRSGLSVSSSSA